MHLKGDYSTCLKTCSVLVTYDTSFINVCWMNRLIFKMIEFVWEDLYDLSPNSNSSIIWIFINRKHDSAEMGIILNWNHLYYYSLWIHIIFCCRLDLDLSILVCWFGSTSCGGSNECNKVHLTALERVFELTCGYK